MARVRKRKHQSIAAVLIRPLVLPGSSVWALFNKPVTVISRASSEEVLLTSLSPILKQNSDNMNLHQSIIVNNCTLIHGFRPWHVCTIIWSSTKTVNVKKKLNIVQPHWTLDMIGAHSNLAALRKCIRTNIHILIIVL